jgi:hypothetical protein
MIEQEVSVTKTREENGIVVLETQIWRCNGDGTTAQSLTARIQHCSGNMVLVEGITTSADLVRQVLAKINQGGREFHCEVGTHNTTGLQPSLPPDIQS